MSKAEANRDLHSLSNRSATVGAMALLAWLWPSVVLACPVCFVAREASRLAFLWTAILMTFLPLCMMGGLVYWLWRQAQRQAAQQAPHQVSDHSADSSSTSNASR